MKPYIVWDWNGTLFDDRMLVMDAMALALSKNGFPEPSTDQMGRHFARPLRAFFERLVARALSVDEWTHLESAFHEVYADRRHHCGLIPGARETLANWKAEGGRQSLVSMWPHEELLDIVTSHGLIDLFDEIRGRRELSDKRASVLEVIRDQGLDPVSVVLVGDALEDVVAARAAGVAVLLVPAASLETFSEKDQRALAVPVVDSVIDVPCAAFSLIGSGGASGGGSVPICTIT